MYCRPILLMYKILISACDEYENDFATDQKEKDSQLKCDRQAAQRGLMYIMIKMEALFRFRNDLEKI